jgi:tetratricopeptide (TPR) repeat protein
MSDSKRQQIARSILEDALNLPTGESGTMSGHVSDDEELLLDWVVGDLSVQQHRSIVDHMADCPSCRREIAAMVQAGALVLPEAESEEPPSIHEAPSAIVSSPVTRKSRGPTYAVTAAAAAILVAFVWGSYGGRDGAGSTLAMVQRDLEAGRSSEAYKNVSDLLQNGGRLSEDERAKAARLLEESGYRTARERLGNKDLPGVSSIENTVAERAAPSARLLNLRIQAERGETKEHSLTGKTSLTHDYGYERNGQRVIKDSVFPQITPTIKRLGDALAEAVSEHPDSLDLRLNFGQFLFEQNDYLGAAEQFAEAVRIDPTSVLAETGLGLALFRQDKLEAIQQALGHFRKAVELGPDSAAAKENLAVCLMRLGEEEEAEALFREVK